MKECFHLLHMTNTKVLQKQLGLRPKEFRTYYANKLYCDHLQNRDDSVKTILRSPKNAECKKYIMKEAIEFTAAILNHKKSTLVNNYLFKCFASPEIVASIPFNMNAVYNDLLQSNVLDERGNVTTNYQMVINFTSIAEFERFVNTFTQKPHVLCIIKEIITHYETDMEKIKQICDSKNIPTIVITKE